MDCMKLGPGSRILGHAVPLERPSSFHGRVIVRSQNYVCPATGRKRTAKLAQVEVEAVEFRRVAATFKIEFHPRVLAGDGFHIDGRGDVAIEEDLPLIFGQDTAVAGGGDNPLRPEQFP
jgi:hypothetical protein